MIIISLFRSLSHVKVDNSLKTGIEYNQRVLEAIGVVAGSSVLLLNGIVIQEDELNIYRYSMVQHGLILVCVY